MAKKVLKWITNIITAILLLILLVLVYTRCVKTFTHKAYPDYFGYTLLEIASGSMEPTLSIQDVVLVKLDKENIKENDIIAYQDKDSIITHRVILIDKDNFTVKGDANNTIDDIVPRSNIVGKVVKTYKELGIWKSILMEPKILVGIFITLILFDVALSYQGKESDKKKKDKEKSKKEEVKVHQIQEMKPEEKESLLEFTRKIDLEEINAMLDKEEIKLSKQEVKNLKKNLSKPELPKLKENEKKFLEYTMRLDLNEIQKKIQKKVK